MTDWAIETSNHCPLDKSIIGLMVKAATGVKQMNEFFGYSMTHLLHHSVAQSFNGPIIQSLNALWHYPVQPFRVTFQLPKAASG